MDVKILIAADNSRTGTMGSGGSLKQGVSAYCAVKYAFIILNVLIWFLGFGVLTVGIWMHVNRAPYMTLLPNSSFLSATVITICVGAVIFTVGFCGCCATIMEYQCMHVVYFVFVLVIFGMEITAMTFSLTHKEEIQLFLYEEVMLSINEDYDPRPQETANSGVVIIIDAIQRTLKCCGIDNQTDWYSISVWPGQNNVPTSCCVQPIQGCGNANSNAALHLKGCRDEVKYWFMRNMYTLGILALVVAVVQILAMISAVAMFCCLRKNKSIL